ncbi:Homeobox-leucine zipper protein HOX32 [Platanthera guangdongensis]|uniref:Homeobox-leucine zipper protein HOX32 n=1 Tax=Platanthera guangdongensis TaxID=2320717 RepID=A0ABR2M5A5_9ASPA
MLIPASSAHLHLSHLFSSSSSSCADSEAEKEGKIDLLTHLSSYLLPRPAFCFDLICPSSPFLTLLCRSSQQTLPAASLQLDSPEDQLRGFLGSHVIIPLAQTVENEEVLEVVRLESHGFIQEDVLSRDMYLLQLCSGIDERAIGACAQLVFAPIDESFADDAFLLPSGFREPPLSATRTLDLSSALDNGGGSTGRAASDALSNTGNSRSVLTIAFQFTFENHLRENVAAMARQYVRSVAASVQQVAMAISLSRLGAQLRPKQHKLLYC